MRMSINCLQRKTLYKSMTATSTNIQHHQDQEVLFLLDTMSVLDTNALQSLLNKLQSSSLEFNQQFEDDTNEEATADVRHCYALFMELGDYLNNKMNMEISKIKKKENESQNLLLPSTKKIYKSPDLTDKLENVSENCSKCNTNRQEHVDIKQNIGSKPQDTSINFHNQNNSQGISYPCKMCKFVSPNYIVLRGHMKLEHDKEEKKICIKCGFETADLKVFKKHLNIVHAKKIKITQYRKI